MYDLVTFGEAMIRLSPPDFKRLEQTTTLDLNIGGSELNVAVGVARLGLKSAWVSRLPDNPLGRMIANKARELGVDVTPVIWEEGGRAGLYFLEFGATPRPTSVIYDRANSSFCNIQPGEVNWDEIFKSCKYLHLTGITPAVSRSSAAATLEALQKARASDCRVSLDLNYRAKLWSPAEANKTLAPMMSYVDILITTQGDTRTILGIEAETDESLAKVLLNQYPIEMVAVSYREGDTVWRCRFSAIAMTRAKTYRTRTYHIDIVDQVGRGDSFAAGFLYGVIGADDPQAGLDYGVAFAALKHSFPGDFNWCTKDEVEALLAGPRPGVQR
ncbi:2-dehydro-3-deoxygluconokinase (EC [Olavius algarvensis Delta 1 endosymbiont]|nr:2-dehydro-3-deoxygluconokinase (EC [Olavius algarvensis Delta 1 endosymbiont]